MAAQQMQCVAAEQPIFLVGDAEIFHATAPQVAFEIVFAVLLNEPRDVQILVGQLQRDLRADQRLLYAHDLAIPLMQR